MVSGLLCTYDVNIICLFSRDYRSLRFFLHLSDRCIIYFFIAASYMPWYVTGIYEYVYPSVLHLLINCNYCIINFVVNNNFIIIIKLTDIICIVTNTLCYHRGTQSIFLY